MRWNTWNRLQLKSAVCATEHVRSDITRQMSFIWKRATAHQYTFIIRSISQQSEFNDPAVWIKYARECLYLYQLQGITITVCYMGEGFNCYHFVYREKYYKECLKATFRRMRT